MLCKERMKTEPFKTLANHLHHHPQTNFNLLSFQIFTIQFITTLYIKAICFQIPQLRFGCVCNLVLSNVFNAYHSWSNSSKYFTKFLNSLQDILLSNNNLNLVHLSNKLLTKITSKNTNFFKFISNFMLNKIFRTRIWSLNLPVFGDINIDFVVWVVIYFFLVWTLNRFYMNKRNDVLVDEESLAWVWYFSL